MTTSKQTSVPIYILIEGAVVTSYTLDQESALKWVGQEKGDEGSQYRGFRVINELEFQNAKGDKT